MHLHVATTRVLFLVAAAVGLLGTVGCPDPGNGNGNPDAGPIAIGREGGRCFSNGLCAAPLQCVANVCVTSSNTGEGEGEGEGDIGEGEGEGEGEPGCPDLDGDGHFDIACGGDDCNDTNAAIHPGATEKCSYVDENCDGQNNEGLDCTFVASTANILFKIDPFKLTATQLASVSITASGAMLDIDRDPDGNILAVTGSGLFELSGTSLTQLATVQTPTNTNGMAIAHNGLIYLTNDVGAWRVDRGTGVVTEIGPSTPYRSSGDCVVDKGQHVFMSSPDPDTHATTGDLFVLIDPLTAAPTLVGAIGFPHVFGLSASFGFLFAVTKEGHVLQIDPGTGAGTLLFTKTGTQFFGAANGD